MDSDPHQPLNFIVIISDTLRRDFLSCYGNTWIRTPHIQHFADQALVFDNAYSASFPTVPNRRDVFTGCYTATYTPWAPLTEKEPVIQTVLNHPKYTTMLIADEPHILENGYNYQRGFDGWDWIRGQEHDNWLTTPRTPEFKCDPRKMRNAEGLQSHHMRVRSNWKNEGDYFPGRTATAACNWLELNYNQGPFYLYVDFFDPHEPWDAPQWYVDMYDPNYTGEVVDYPQYAKWREFLSEAELKHCRALYAAEVTMIDRWVGRIFEKVEDLGLMDNTVVIFTTDHGFLLGEHGFIGKSLIRGSYYNGVLSYLPLYEEINHIPLLIYTPNGKTGRTSAIVQPPDIAPTIADLAGQPFLACQGESYKDVLVNAKETHRPFAVSFPYLDKEGIPISFVKENYAAVFFSKIEPKKLHKDSAETAEGDKAVDGLEKTIEPWENAKDMLFDLTQDPAQEHDIAPDHPDLIAQFKAELLQFLDDSATEEKIINRWR